MDWAIGERMSGRWDIHRVFRGGLGIVYIVFDHHPEFRQMYAAKTFQDKAFERHPEMLSAFGREANAWIGLERHPNIVTAHFVEQIRGKPYLFLEYVDGGDLSNWIGSPNSRRNLEPILRMFLQFCDGMVHASSKGLVVHRDIKPQNCLLTSSGVLKITDFGLAKLFGVNEGNSDRRRARHDSNSTAGGTRTGDSMGTPTHMPPEQFEDAKRTDMRGDIYSFGIMMYQMLSGRLPFLGRTWDDLRTMHRQNLPPDISEIPVGLKKIVFACLEKDPAARIQNFAVLHTSLSEVFRQTVGTHPPPPITGDQLQAFELCNKGASLASLGFHDRALEIYEQVLKVWPEDSKTWINKGASLHQMRRFAEAIDCYVKAISLDSTFAGSWINRGLSHAKLEQFAEAKRSFKKALALSPADTRAWIELGVIYEKQGNIAEAERCFRKAHQLDPDRTESVIALAGFLTKLNRNREALALYDASLRLNDRQVAVWLNRGVALEQNGEPEIALLSYARVLKLDPGNALAWSWRGNALFKLKRIDDALDAYAKSIELDPDDAQIWVNRGICFTECGKFEDALNSFEKAHSLGHPGGPELIAMCQKYV